MVIRTYFFNDSLFFVLSNLGENKNRRTAAKQYYWCLFSFFLMTTTEQATKNLFHEFLEHFYLDMTHIFSSPLREI